MGQATSFLSRREVRLLAAALALTFSRRLFKLMVAGLNCVFPAEERVLGALLVLGSSLLVLSVLWSSRKKLANKKLALAAPEKLALASSTSPRTLIADTLTCEICFEAYNERERVPLNLPCGHTVCKACLLQFGRKFCPHCRSAYKDSADSLPKNFALIHLLTRTSGGGGGGGGGGSVEGGEDLLYNNRIYSTAEFKTNQAKTPAKGIFKTHTGKAILNAVRQDKTAVLHALVDEWFANDVLNYAEKVTGNTALHCAAIRGRTEMVKVLASAPGADVLRRCNAGFTPLDLSVDEKIKAVLRQRQKKDAEKRS